MEIYLKNSNVTASTNEKSAPILPNKCESKNNHLLLGMGPRIYFCVEWEQFTGRTKLYTKSAARSNTEPGGS